MRRGGHYCLRAKVPKDLRLVIGKREIWKSLGTGDHKVALKRLRVASVEVDRQYDAARRKLPNSPRTPYHGVRDFELEQLVRTWFQDRNREAIREFDDRSGDTDRRRRRGR